MPVFCSTGAVKNTSVDALGDGISHALQRSQWRDDTIDIVA